MCPRQNSRALRVLGEYIPVICLLQSTNASKNDVMTWSFRVEIRFFFLGPGFSPQVNISCFIPSPKVAATADILLFCASYFQLSIHFNLSSEIFAFPGHRVSLSLLITCRLTESSHLNVSAEASLGLLKGHSVSASVHIWFEWKC